MKNTVQFCTRIINLSNSNLIYCVKLGGKNTEMGFSFKIIRKENILMKLTAIHFVEYKIIKRSYLGS